MMIAYMKKEHEDEKRMNEEEGEKPKIVKKLERRKRKNKERADMRMEEKLQN